MAGISAECIGPDGTTFKARLLPCQVLLLWCRESAAQCEGRPCSVCFRAVGLMQPQPFLACLQVYPLPVGANIQTGPLNAAGFNAVNGTSSTFVDRCELMVGQPFWAPGWLELFDGHPADACLVVLGLPGWLFLHSARQARCQGHSAHSVALPRPPAAPWCCSLAGLGNTGGVPFAHSCPGDARILGIDVSAPRRAWAGLGGWGGHGWRPQARSVCGWCGVVDAPELCAVAGLRCWLQVAVNDTAAGDRRVSGLRFLCGDPTCRGLGGVAPSSPPALLPPPPPPVAAPAGPVGDWSPWLGRSAGNKTIGICPCPGYIQVRRRPACARAASPPTPPQHLACCADQPGCCWQALDPSAMPLLAELLHLV